MSKTYQVDYVQEPTGEWFLYIDDAPICITDDEGWGTAHPCAYLSLLDAKAEASRLCSDGAMVETTYGLQEGGSHGSH